MPQKDGIHPGIWVLTGLVLVSLALLTSYLMHTHRQLKQAEHTLGQMKDETVRAQAGAAEQAKEHAKEADALKAKLKKARASQSDLHDKLAEASAALKATKTTRDRLRETVDKADAKIADLHESLEVTQAEVEETQSRLRNVEQELRGVRRATDQLREKLENRQKRIARLRKGMAACEDFFDDWETTGAPASLSAIAAVGREAAAAKDCIDKENVALACKHWQGLLVEIEKIGSPVNDSRSEIEHLMQENNCTAKGHRPPARDAGSP